ncbi:MAG: domain S-box-containing protein/diguanylate cyclase protein [Frankiales bacterium]|nr:domain S-box-containing protein/diguanylate cyclase protein [Frankiales bacterium]
MDEVPDPSRPVELPVSSSCLGCACTSPRTVATSGRLLLATQVAHTAADLRALARAEGVALRPLAPGLLALDRVDVDRFVAAAQERLSSVEAAEVRCLVLPDDDLPDVAVLSQALTAPTLAAAGARVRHADLLPLFADEAACFHTVYQPILTLQDRRPVGYEALLRGVTPDGVPVLPDVLFPAAEAADWTHLLDRVGRTTALRDAAGWLPSDQLLFINFVPTSIYRPEVCLRTTEQAAEAAGVRLDQIVFEVTEGHRVRDLDHLERVFDHYRASRCQVALDDVGAGYSSLNLLVRLKPDIVKLDKEIVQALPEPTSRAVVKAIVEITHSYGGTVLAECLETEDQAASALELGVDLGQGWLFGRPERRGEARPHAIPRARLEGRASAGPVDPGRPDPAVAVPDHVLQRLAGAGPDGMSALLVRAVDGSRSGVVVVDVRADDQPVLYVNPAFEAMTGYPGDEVVGRNCRLLQGEGTDPDAVRALSQAVRAGRQHTTVLRNYRKDGSPWWNELHLSPVHDDAGRLTHYLGYQHDVTGRVETEERLARQATHDGLTGLANRARMLERLDAALVEAAADGTAVAVLYVDLDGFKGVNDDLGHAAGDQVLVQVAERLRATLRTTDLLCRNGGDEFVAVLRGLAPLDAERVVGRAAADLTAALGRPYVAGGTTARLGGSVGSALFPAQGTTADRLLALADDDMYRVKRTPGAVGPGRL